MASLRLLILFIFTGFLNSNYSLAMRHIKKDIDTQPSLIWLDWHKHIDCRECQIFFKTGILSILSPSFDIYMDHLKEENKHCYIRYETTEMTLALLPCPYCEQEELHDREFINFSKMPNHLLKNHFIPFFREKLNFNFHRGNDCNNCKNYIKEEDFFNLRSHITEENKIKELNLNLNYIPCPWCFEIIKSSELSRHWKNIHR